VYAGQGDKGRSLGDFYVLNTKTWMWKKLFMLETPHFRQNHTINEMRQQEKLIFGGVCLPDGTLLNDLWSVNYSNVAFASNLSEIPGAVWTQLKAKGDIPEARKGHCAITVNKNIIVFGGKTAEPEDPSNIFILNYGIIVIIFQL
jgi:N-acetylneuraminic acid mutarotase